MLGEEVALEPGSDPQDTSCPRLIPEADPEIRRQGVYWGRALRRNL